MDEWLNRYSGEELSVIASFFNKLAKATRKTGKISVNARETIIASFDSFDTDIVIAAMKIYMDMDIPTADFGGGKNEKYVRGIMVNKQAEKNKKGGGARGGNRKHGDGNCGTVASPRGDGEGERLQRIAGAADFGQLECDF